MTAGGRSFDVRSNAIVLATALGLLVGLGTHGQVRNARGQAPQSREESAPAPSRVAGQASLPSSAVHARLREGRPLPIARPAPLERKGAVSAERGDAQLERLIAKNGLQAQRDVIERVVPPGPVSKPLVNLVLLSGFQNAVGSEEAQRMFDEVRELEAQPAAAGEAIVSTLESLPGEFTQSRQTLVTFLRQLNLPVEQRDQLLQRVLNRALPEPVGDAEDMTGFGAIAALQALMDMHMDDPKALQPMVEKAMQAQRDNPELQRLLLLTYTSIAPEHARDLRAQLELP